MPHPHDNHVFYTSLIIRRKHERSCAPFTSNRRTHTNRIHINSIITTKRSIHVGSNVSIQQKKNPSPPLATEADRSSEKNCMYHLNLIQATQIEVIPPPLGKLYNENSQASKAQVVTITAKNHNPSPAQLHCLATESTYTPPFANSFSFSCNFFCPVVL